MSLDRNVYPIPDGIAPVIDHFEKITDIPRPSGGEEGIRRYLIDFAVNRKLERRVDGRGNLAIDVPASEGCEGQPRVVLQAHMDMVTFPGKNDVNPTQAYIDEEGLMRARGGTTLGADNGIGMSMALALSEDQDFRHGPITILITVHEEATPMGARALDPKIVPDDAAFLMNLDSEEGPGFICRGCAASCDVEGIMEIGERENLPDGFRVMEINLSGLPGGHSGVNIHEERGNAIRLLNGLLFSISRSLERQGTAGLKLIEYSGGDRRNVIPSSAKCVVAVPGEIFDFIERELIPEFVWQMKKFGNDGVLSEENAKNLAVEVKEQASGEVKAVSDLVRNGLMAAIANTDDGVYHKIPTDFGGGVLLSSNMGVLGKEPNDDDGRRFRLSVMARGAELNALKAKVAELKSQMATSGLDHVDVGSAGGAWLEDENSPAIVAAVQAAVENELPHVIFAYHAGLECAHIQDRIAETGRPRLSAVSVGPEIKDAHSKNERITLDSVAQTYWYIKGILKELWKESRDM